MRRRSILKVVTVAIMALAVTTLAACSSGQAGLSVGDRAPDFTLPAAEGGTVSLGDYTGVQPALLYFHMAMG